MPKGYRLLFIAFFEWLTLAGTAQNQNRQREQTHSGTGQYQSVAPRVVAKPPDDPGSSQSAHEQCIGYDGRQAHCERAAMDATIEQARDADWQADTSIVGTFIEFVTMGAAIGAAIWAKQAAQATKQGASATLDAVKHSREGNKIARESDRPWLDFEIIGDLQIRKFGSPEIWVGIKVPMNVTNYGKSPAIKPAMICKIIKGRVDSNETISVIAKQIQAGKGSASEPIFGGVTKFNWSNMSHAYEIDPEYGIRFDALDFFIGEFILFIVIGYTSNGTDFFYTGKLYSLNAEKYGCGSFIIEPEPTFGGYFTVVV